MAPGFSHAVSLFAVALTLWLWLRAREEDSLPRWLAVGLAGGLAGLAREQDALFLAAPFLDLALRSLRPGALRGVLARGLAMGTAAFLVFVPQLFAYKAINGRYGPSTLVARKMVYSSPHFLQVLCDPGHGLFLWAPLLLPAVIGLVLLARRMRPPVPALLATAFLLQVWINGSLDSWTQAGAFGSRRFVAATPVLAFGLAALLMVLLPRLGRGLTAALLLVFVWWNLSLMVQFGLRLMDRQRLEWPRVAQAQVYEVPRRLGRALWLFFTDRERLVREGA